MLTEGTYLADRYEINEKIGAGGMSDVYKAKDHVLDRYVAIKVLKTEFSEDMNFVAKFRTEAQSAASLEHPNIVNIYDVGSENGLHYIVMEYVEGITLKTYIEKKGQLAFKEAVSIAIQISKGIEAAHNKEITHRDIKPQNIIISTEGKVKVTDFGIARAASSNTISADVMGSVHYASPEQARNGFVDSRSDIYSLGIVMYEMVTGRVPFDGDTTVSVALQHLQDEMVVPSQYARDLPISLEKIILKCAQKNPDRRYQTIDELLTDLRKSLVTPNEDFVKDVPIDENAKTRVISPNEIKQINNEARKEKIVDDKENDKANVENPEIEEDEEESEEGKLNPKMDKAVTIMGIIAAIVIVIVIIYLVLSVLGLVKIGKKSSEIPSQKATTQTETQSETEEVKVPDVVGMSTDEAQKKLEEAGLEMQVTETKDDSSYEEGDVIETTPKAGEKAKKGSTVSVVVCGKSTKSVGVPNVVGMSESAASNTLEGKGFKVNKKYQFSDSVAAGNVISQTPAGRQSVVEGSAVTIIISQGVESVSVPSVIGQSQANAENVLSGAGLNVSVKQDYSNTVAQGNVISQSISAGKTVQKGSGITLVVSLGAKQTETASTYSYTQTLNVPTGAVSVDVKLYDSTGKLVGTASNSSISETATSFRFSKTGISSTTGTGKLVVTWHHKDGSTSTEGSSDSVTFTKG
ncbi:serine/threonine protein kinase [Lachnospiraceae bacterium C7]|nr:serine/threonine protein kinase [Lachnospiraceae bacterium C7]